MTENNEIKNALDCICKAMQKDFDYAWGWHCNIACAIQNEKISHKVANKIATRIMRMLFLVDTSAEAYTKWRQATSDTSDNIE